MSRLRPRSRVHPRIPASSAAPTSPANPGFVRVFRVRSPIPSSSAEVNSPAGRGKKRAVPTRTHKSLSHTNLSRCAHLTKGERTVRFWDAVFRRWSGAAGRLQPRAGCGGGPAVAAGLHRRAARRGNRDCPATARRRRPGTVAPAGVAPGARRPRALPGVITRVFRHPPPPSTHTAPCPRRQRHTPPRPPSPCPPPIHYRLPPSPPTRFRTPHLNAHPPMQPPPHPVHATHPISAPPRYPPLTPTHRAPQTPYSPPTLHPLTHTPPRARASVRARARSS